MCLLSMSLVLAKSSSATAGSTRLEGRLLALSASSSGWNVGPGRFQLDTSCVALPKVAQLVGSHGVGSIDHRDKGSEVFAEYAVWSTSIFKTFESADAILSNHSCSESQGSQVRFSISMGQLFDVPTYGDWSIGEVRNVVFRGTKSQVGYVLVRKGNLFVVVAYGNQGLLAKRTLENYTKSAFAKLTAN
jgi:hypothetical protein